MKIFVQRFLPLLSSLSFVLALNACGSSSGSSSSPAPATATTWTNTAMQSIVVNNCAISGCHNGTTSPNFTNISEANMKANTTARDQVAAGLMPQSGSLTTAQKTTFANFYK